MTVVDFIVYESPTAENYLLALLPIEKLKLLLDNMVFMLNMSIDINIKKPKPL